MLKEVLRSVAKALPGITFGIPGADQWEYARRFVTGQLLGGGSGALEEPYRQHPIIAKAVGTIARDAASVEWMLHRVTATGKVRDQPDAKHPVISVWAKPNPWMNGRQLWIGSYISKYMFGEYFWYFPNLQITRPTPGSAPRIEDILDAPASLKGDAQILLLDPRMVIVKPVGDTLKYLQRTKEGEEIPLDEKKIIHSKRWNPYNHLRGLSIIESLIYELQGDHAASQWNSRFFGDQNGVPSGLLIPGGSMVGALGEDQKRDYRRMWNQRHSGSKRSVAVLPAGWSFQDLGISQRDMDFKGLREYSREIILGTIGVPPFLAGVLEKANYSNAREQKDVYWNHTIEPFLDDEAEIINTDFFPKVGIDNYVVRPNWEKVKALLENLIEKSDVGQKWFDMGLSKKVINERLDMGWNPDDIPDYEVSYLTLQKVPVEDLSDARVLAAPALPAGPDSDEPDEEGPEGEEPAATRQRAVIAHGREFSRTLRWKAIIGKRRKLEEEFRSKIRQHFESLRQEVQSNLSGLKGFVARQKDDADLLLFDASKADAKLQKVTKPTYEKAINEGATGVLAELDLGTAFQVEDPRVVAQALKLSRKIKNIDRTLERQLRKTIVESLENQETPLQLAKRIDHTFDVGKVRSRAIARTEIGIAHNTGRFIGMKEAGIEKHEWLSSQDAEVRETHAPGTGDDGVVVKLGELFPTTMLEYPQHPDGLPEEIIQCRCTTVPVVEDDDED